jgi:hypothetical protein
MNRVSRVRTVMAAAVIAAAGSFAAVPSALTADAAVTVTSHFIWTTTSSNVNIWFSFINNGATNGNPNALLFVTPVDDAGGVCGCTEDTSPVGVFWAGGADEWTLINLNETDMPVGVSFNVLVVQKPTSQVFVASSTATNSTGNGMTISSKAINGKGAALLQVTASMPAGLGSVLDGHPLGVVYGLGTGGNEWDIQNVDNATMPVGAKFNVMVGGKPSNGGKAVLLTGTSGNTTGSETYISNKETTGNPNAVVFETQNADPSLNFGTGDVAPTGMIYVTSPTDEMAVFNEDGSSMPATTHYFNLLIFPS